jgi:hypothetical protein
MLPHARHYRAQALQIRIPSAPPRVIRVADDVSIVRRFAAKFTLQCHFSSCFNFIWAWISCSKCPKTKLLILADTPPPAKRAIASKPFPWAKSIIACGLTSFPFPVLEYGIRKRGAYQ